MIKYNLGKDELQLQLKSPTDQKFITLNTAVAVLNPGKDTIQPLTERKTWFYQKNRIKLLLLLQQITTNLVT